MPTVAAILSASLLGAGLAYGACAVLLPAIAHEKAGASLTSADDPSQGVICTSSNPSTSPQAVRADP